MTDEDVEGAVSRAAPPPRPRRKLSSRTIAAIALGAVAVVLLALILLVPAPEGAGEGSPGALGAPSSGPGGPASAGAPLPGSDEGAYRPLPALEALIGSLRRRAEFRVVSPGEKAAPGTLIVFRWETELQGPWKVSILDNRGIALKEEEVSQPDYTLSSPKPALYYWTVAKEDTLLHAGRFSVR